MMGCLLCYTRHSYTLTGIIRESFLFSEGYGVFQAEVAHNLTGGAII